MRQTKLEKLNLSRVKNKLMLLPNMKKLLRSLLSLTLLIFFSYEGACASKEIHPANDKKFSNFDVEGLLDNDSRHFIEYKRPFCGQYSMRIIVADSNEVMGTILEETANLI